VTFLKKGLKVFKKPILVDKVSSTQDVVKGADFPPFVPLIAKTQTNGRGRKGNLWYSPPGKGLYLSVKLPKEIFKNILNLGTISLVSGYAVSETVDSYTFSKIKWPNDVYINGKKVSGILIEANSKSLVIGIGVNLNTLNFPKELEKYATSIYRETGTEVDFEEFTLLLLENLEDNLLKFQKKGFKPFLEAINRKLLWKGKRITVDNRECGTLLCVDSEGFAVIKTCYGQIKRFPVGDISIRKLKYEG
jgi:BirA family biotin operon repressor/biotin-[acetyl-CoA-carboxylase] ligase